MKSKEETNEQTARHNITSSPATVPAARTETAAFVALNQGNTYVEITVKTRINQMAAVALAERHAERIVHVHCKDVRGPVLEESRRTDTSFMQAVLDGIFTVPGDGAIDFPAIMSALAKVDYGGWLVVEAEQDPAKAHPLTYATMGRENLGRMARDAGLHVQRTPSREDR